IDTTGTVLNKIFVSPSLSPYSLAFDGKNYLILGMLDTTGMGENSDIYGIRVTSGGVVLDTTPIFITNNSWDEAYCSACFDGTNFVIVWEDFRNGMNNSDIYGCSMDTSGKVVNRFLVTNQTGYQLFPTLTKGPGAQLLTTYSGWTPAPYNTIRVWGKLSPFTGVEESSISDFGLRNLDLKIRRNPFSQSTVISYSIPAKGKVELTVYDISGRTVKTLVDGEKETGSYSVNLNAKELKTGVYFVRLTAGKFNTTKKITVIR
ncbi:MAG: T9SS type A sorting domain-containing protein, partial [bacterium]|nr:T9SS type A sorting domain-containing protein [bacterium]